MLTRFQTVSRGLAALALSVLAMCGLATSAHAQVTGVPIFFTNYYLQTASTVAYNGSTFDARLFETNSNDVVNATLTYPGPASPGIYTPTTYSTTILDYGKNEPSEAAMQTDFPVGTYTVQYGGGAAGSGSASANYTQSAFSSSIPMLTQPTYDGLQGLDVNQPFTIFFNGDAPTAASNENDVFVNIFDHNTGSLAYGQQFQPVGTTSEFLPAGTLSPNTDYDLQVIFSNRISTNTGGAAPIDTTLGFDRDTSVSFKTASAPVPEASTTVSLGLLLCLGLIGLTMGARRHAKSNE